MSDKHQRMAALLAEQALPNSNSSMPASRVTFLDWSRRTERASFVPKIDSTRTLGIHTRLMATIYPWRAINIQIGHPYASIKVTGNEIRHPQPFGPSGLTENCRTFIIDVVRQAIENDGLHRWITWPETPMLSN